MKLGQDRFSFCCRPTRVPKVVTTPCYERSPARCTARPSRSNSRLCMIIPIRQEDTSPSSITGFLLEPGCGLAELHSELVATLLVGFLLDDVLGAMRLEKFTTCFVVIEAGCGIAELHSELVATLLVGFLLDEMLGAMRLEDLRHASSLSNASSSVRNRRAMFT